MADLTAGLPDGVLIEVVEAEGAGLVGDYASSATTLTVSSGGFRSAGSCRIADESYAYTRSDSGNVLTITPGLAAAATDGDPVVSLDQNGRPETQKLAVLDLDGLGDPEGDARAWIPGELAGFYPLGTEAAGAIVSIVDIPYGYRVQGRPVDAPTLRTTYSTAEEGERIEMTTDYANEIRFWPEGDTAAFLDHLDPTDDQIIPGRIFSDTIVTGGGTGASHYVQMTTARSPISPGAWPLFYLGTNVDLPSGPVDTQAWLSADKVEVQGSDIKMYGLMQLGDFGRGFYCMRFGAGSQNTDANGIVTVTHGNPGHTPLAVFVTQDTFASRIISTGTKNNTTFEIRVRSDTGALLNGVTQDYMWMAIWNS